MEHEFTSPMPSRIQGRNRHQDGDRSQSQTLNFDETGLHSIPSYREYLTNQPFIYDDFRRTAVKPIKSYPESNRQAVMSALRGLQDKIRQLELERSQAENNLRTLASETTRYRDILEHEYTSQAVQTSLSKETHGIHEMTEDTMCDTDTQENTVDQVEDPSSVQHENKALEIDTQLQGAENRCSLLQKQLDYMRKMVQNAEKDRADAIRRSALLERQQENLKQSEIKSQIDKIMDLERDHLRLTATQTLAEKKIRELEEKLGEEKHHRKMTQDKAAELESQAEANRIFTELTRSSPTVKRPVKKKKKIVVANQTNKMASSRTPRRVYSRSPKRPMSAEPMDHYRLNLAEIPFVAGKATTPSHSLPANVQKVLSLMKSHNPMLCPTSPCIVPSSTGSSHYHRPSSSSGFSSDNDLADLLMQLQDEFGGMSFEHQELSRQISEAKDLRMREDLERELDSLVSRMESKGEQVARLRRYQGTMGTKKKQKKKTRKTAKAGSTVLPTAVNGEVEVTTTIRTKSRSTNGNPRSPVIGNRTHASRIFLNDLKKIQSTLRKDDLSWDC